MADTDNGPMPLVMNIEQATLQNTNYRTTLWTGSKLQLTVMSIEPGHDIGLEVHNDRDQFLRIEAGEAKVLTGDSEDNLREWSASDNDAIFVPAGTWHNLINVGTTNLQLYSIYAPPEHPHGTVHETKADADDSEHEEEE